MPLPAGSRLGQYEVVAALGEGGMGEVYRAQDVRLGRAVAIKVLPDSFAADAERIARLEREAKVLAALNHPHIAALYGIEQSDGRHFLVMELVEGETLADRIARGPIPVADAVRLAVQIAEALEAAHEKGIVHRDLKPGNISVTADDRVKVLDFGLAKTFDNESAASGLTHSPTLSIVATQAGMILGTAAYMSPEQARGRQVDKRSDVWAFGCVLYEMLTGRRAFEGEDVTDIIAAIVRGEPDWAALPSNVSEEMRLLLKRALDKDRRTRIGDLSTARFLLTETLTAAVATKPPPTVERRSKWRTSARGISRRRGRTDHERRLVVRVAAACRARRVAVFDRAP